MKVGVFDSGIGGLTVLSKLKKKYPLNDYIYFGDTLNIPYGTKDIDTLYTLSCNIIDFLISNNVDLIVIACGTISSNCYYKLKDKYNIPIIDIISPTIEFIKKERYDSVGVLATRRTVNAHIFKNLLPNILVYEVNPDSFVPLIESGNTNKIDVNYYLDKIKSNNIVLGCTHYPLIKDKIKNRNVIDMADNITLNFNSGNGKVNLYFSKLSNEVLSNIKLFDLGKYNVYEKNF